MIYKWSNSLNAFKKDLGGCVLHVFVLWSSFQFVPLVTHCLIHCHLLFYVSLIGLFKHCVFFKSLLFLIACELVVPFLFLVPEFCVNKTNTSELDPVSRRFFQPGGDFFLLLSRFNPKSHTRSDLEDISVMKL